MQSLKREDVDEVVVLALPEVDHQVLVLDVALLAAHVTEMTVEDVMIAVWSVAANAVLIVATVTLNAMSLTHKCTWQTSQDHPAEKVSKNTSQKVVPCKFVTSL